jgi:transcriptional regulator with XRE-family HTH domain
MQVLGVQLRRRARELDLTDAEVARRAGLSPRRYGNYVTGDREPDLQTLVRICRVLTTTTPDQVLGFVDAKSAKTKSERDRLIDKLLATAELLNDAQLKLAVRHLEVISESS